MRAATGYAFHSIQRWAEACAMSIEAGNAPIAPARNRVLEAMDRLFLSVLRERPAEAAALFGRLFYKCDPDPLIRFLAGVPRVGDFWPVVNALPKRRFLRALPALSRADFSSNGALS